MICTESKRRLGVRQGDHIYYFADCNKIFKNIVGKISRPTIIAYSARTAHPFQRNGAPFRFKLSKAQQVD